MNDKKPAQIPIPANAEILADKLTVEFEEGKSPHELGIDSSEWKAMDSRLKELGVIEYERVFSAESGALSRFYSLTLAPNTDIRAVRAEIYTFDSVKSSDPEPIMRTQATANDPYFPEMWGLQKIQAGTAWDKTKGSNAVTVAVIDTGIDYNHTDFSGRNIIRGEDFNSCTATANGQCVSRKERDTDPMDDNGHGTHVAGTIGAATNNGIGVSGVNWNVSLLVIKSLGGVSGTGLFEDIVKGMEYAVNSDASIINMSLGGEMPSCPSAYQTIIDIGVSRGKTFVVAAGNADKDTNLFTPANCNGVIVVGATSPTDTRAIYSNHGSKVDIAAPGGDKGGAQGTCTQSNCILSTWPGNNLKAIQGTSMASPHVAGVAALILAQNPSFSPTEIKQCLLQSASPISTDKEIGGKLLNAAGAVNGCTPSSSNPSSPNTSVTPGGGSVSPTGTAGQEKYFIRGELYRDENKNMTKDDTEGPFEGVTVSLSGPVTRSITTDSTGTYLFSNLAQGAYTLETSYSGTRFMEYKFSLTDTSASWQSETATPPEIMSLPTPAGGGAILTSPSPTPRTLYTCRERESTKRIDNKTVNLKYLDCTPQ